MPGGLFAKCSTQVQDGAVSAAALRHELDGETVIESQSKGAYLRLDREGFTAHPQFGGKDKWHSWDEVSGFKPANVRSARTTEEGPGQSLDRAQDIRRRRHGPGRLPERRGGGGADGALAAEVRGLVTATLRQELDGETIIEARTKGAYLRLDAMGFTGHTKRGKEKGRAWGEVSGFKPANVAMNVEGTQGATTYQIGFFLTDPPKKGRVGRWFFRKMYVVDDTLPGVYPNAEEVVALMERWRQRYSTEP